MIHIYTLIIFSADHNVDVSFESDLDMTLLLETFLRTRVLTVTVTSLRPRRSVLVQL
jgi:hypothetical protein